MRKNMDMQKEKIRNIISLLLIVLFAIVFATGFIMVPFLRDALGTNYMISESGTSPLEMVHTIIGLLMGLFSIIHIALELKHKRQQKELRMKMMEKPMVN